MDNGNMNNGSMNSGAADGAYQQPYYTAQPVYQQNVVVESNVNMEEPVKLGEWLLTFLLLSIPCVGLVMFFVYMFTGKKSRRNLMIASLIWGLIIGAITTIIVLVFGATLSASLVDYIEKASYYGMTIMSVF